MNQSELVATFLAHTKVHFVPPTAAEAATLGERLARAWEDARAQWPDVALPARLFVIHLAEQQPKARPDSPMAPLLESLSLAELYLACACLKGMASAHAAFERDYMAKLPESLQQLKQAASLIDDVCQLVRVKLLVATPEGAPTIGQYTGRGKLLIWMTVIASHISLKLMNAEKPTLNDSEEVLRALPGQGMDPELDVMKRRHQAEFREAVHEALSTLSDHDRHLLRLRFAGGLSTHDLAKLFRVNQSTISRWLASARQQVYEETRSHLQERLGLSTEGFQSFLALVNSQLDLSISKLLDDKGSVLPPTQG